MTDFSRRAIMPAPFYPNPYHGFEPYIDGITMPVPGMNNYVYPTGDDSTGQAIYFQNGQWKNKYIRAELFELQHAEKGRKYAEVDRRSLDPPPVVKLRLFEVVQNSQYDVQEHEISDYENIETTGLLCAAELIPASEINIGQHYFLNSSEHITVPESEIARLTANVMVGSKVVQPHLIDLDGQKSLLFVFPDLAVRDLGLFRLRYKFFDLFSAVPGRDIKIQANCIGGIFRVFSTKLFPGLPVSTDLTKTLSAHGVPLNVRRSERRPKRKRSYSRRQSDEEGYGTSFSKFSKSGK